MVVHNVTSLSEFQNEITTHPAVVLDCFATWCGPCKAISPQVEKFSDEFTNARFLKVDVDEVPELAQELGVRAMPTFFYFKDGEKANEVVGANPGAVKAAVEGLVA